MNPQDPMRSTTSAPAQFEAELSRTTAGLTAYRMTYNHALDIGVRPRELVLYVQGKLDTGARVDFQGLLTQSPWALGRVVALVKAKRVGNVGARVVVSAITDLNDVQAAELLDEV